MYLPFCQYELCIFAILLPKICNKKAFRFGANFSDVKKLLLAEGFLGYTFRKILVEVIRNIFEPSKLEWRTRDADN